MHAKPQKGEPAENALGDWFVTHFVCRKQPYLLLVSSTTRLAILEQAKDVRSLPQRLPQFVELRLAMFVMAAKFFIEERVRFPSLCKGHEKG